MADEEGDKADENAIEQLALSGERAGHVVGRHKDRAEQQAAGHALDQGSVGVAGVQGGQDKDGGHDGDGDGGLDGLCGNQVGKAQQDGQHANLAHHAAVQAQEHIQQADGMAVYTGGQRRGGSQGIYGHIRVDVGGHAGGKAQKQHDTADQRGVGKVITQAAEQLLGDNDGHERTDNGDPDGHANGHVQRQDDAGDNGRQIPYRIGFVEQTLINVLKCHTGEGGDDHQQQGPCAEDQCRSQHSG